MNIAVWSTLDQIVDPNVWNADHMLINMLIRIFGKLISHFDQNADPIFENGDQMLIKPLILIFENEDLMLINRLIRILKMCSKKTVGATLGDWDVPSCTVGRSIHKQTLKFKDEMTDSDSKHHFFSRIAQTRGYHILSCKTCHVTKHNFRLQCKTQIRNYL